MELPALTPHVILAYKGLRDTISGGFWHQIYVHEVTAHAWDWMLIWQASVNVTTNETSTTHQNMDHFYLVYQDLYS